MNGARDEGAVVIILILCTTETCDLAILSL